MCGVGIRRWKKLWERKKVQVEKKRREIPPELFLLFSPKHETFPSTSLTTILAVNLRPKSRSVVCYLACSSEKKEKRRQVGETPNSGESVCFSFCRKSRKCLNANQSCALFCVNSKFLVWNSSCDNDEFMDSLHGCWAELKSKFSCDFSFSDKKCVVWFSVCVKIAKAIKFGIIFYIFFSHHHPIQLSPLGRSPKREEKRSEERVRRKRNFILFSFSSSLRPIHFMWFFCCVLSPPPSMGLNRTKKKLSEKRKKKNAGGMAREKEREKMKNTSWNKWERLHHPRNSQAFSSRRTREIILICK